MRIPIYRPFLCGNEKKYVNECLDSNWISSKGYFINKFEEQFAKYIGVKYASTCSNGTVALHLALLALNIKKGDEVIVPSFTYIASVNSIKHVNATPFFVDSDRETLQVDYEDLKKAISSKTKAIIVPHLYGGCGAIDKLVKLAKEKNIYIIEDAAEAFGCIYKGKHLGTFGKLGTFSFFGNKTLTTGEGGMVVSNDENLIKKINHLKAQGLANLLDNEKKHPEYWHNEIGYNYRMTNICAAIGLAQLEMINTIIEMKRKIHLEYKKNLAQENHFHLFSEDKNLRSSYWMISGLVKDKKTRDFLRDKLQQKGIETRPFFPAAHRMPMYFKKKQKQYLVAEELSQRGLNLPSFPGLKKKEIRDICCLISDVLND